MLRFNVVLAVLAIGYFSIFSGCNGDDVCCSVIESFTAKPQYICPGDIDFAPRAYIQIGNYDQNEKHCESTSGVGGFKWQLWETTKGAPETPGAKKLASPQTHSLLKVGLGVYATPSQGFPAASSPLPGKRQFTLSAVNLNCSVGAQNHMIGNQKKYEKMLGLELDDGKPMQATIQIQQLSPGISTHRICFPHLIDIAGAQWMREVTEFGSKTSIPYIEMVGVANPNSIEIEVSHKPPGASSNTLGWVIKPGGSVDLSGSIGPGVPRNPNGTWKVAIKDTVEYEKYVKHGLKYLGAPPICVEIKARCTQ